MGGYPKNCRFNAKLSTWLDTSIGMLEIYGLLVPLAVAK